MDCSVAGLRLNPEADERQNQELPKRKCTERAAPYAVGPPERRVPRWVGRPDALINFFEPDVPNFSRHASALIGMP